MMELKYQLKRVKIQIRKNLVKVEVLSVIYIYIYIKIN